MRILFVAMHNGVHTARWINQLADTHHEILLFPPYVAPVHDMFKKVERLATWEKRPKGPGTVNLVSLLPLRRGAGRAEMVMSSITGSNNWRVSWLEQVIRRFKPDLVHSLEYQSAGYLCLGARELMGSEFPPWIATNWGSDIYLFGRLPEHHEKICRILKYADYYSAECHRDIKIARDLGFTGQILPVLPAAGGYDLAQMRKFTTHQGKHSARRTIAVKGLQHWSGRALTALDAICIAADKLRDFDIRVYSASPEVELMVKLAAADHGLDISCLPFRCSREDVLRLHASARIYIGIGISDGISTSFLEALVLGAFPIQANTACVDEWIRDGESGFIVSPFRPEEIADKIVSAISDDELVDKAASINAETVDARLNYKVVKREAVRIYEAIEKGECFDRGSDCKVAT